MQHPPPDIQGELWPEEARAARETVRREQEQMRALLHQVRQQLKRARGMPTEDVVQKDSAFPVLRTKSVK